MEKLLKAKKENFKQKYEFCNLVVKSLPKEIKDKNLFEIFKAYGEIKTARVATEGVMKDKIDEQGNILDKEFVYESKGFGYVLFKDAKDASNVK
jgi:RNA recognition motif-containing protein